MTERSFDEFSEDDGVLETADSLDGADLQDDPLDTGIDAGENYRGVTRFGTTEREERQGESLDQLLAEEEPDQLPDEEWTDEDFPSDDGRAWERRAGRLVASDEGSHPDVESDLIAAEVGIDGGGASAEEAAVHLTDDPPFTARSD